MIPIRQFEIGRHLFMATRRGVVKKTELQAYSNPRAGGIIAITLDEGDELIAVRLTGGQRRDLPGHQTGHGDPVWRGRGPRPSGGPAGA